MLKAWFAEKGFGFIAPRKPGADVFCHAKALAVDKQQTPQKLSVVAFQEGAQDGKRKQLPQR